MNKFLLLVPLAVASCAMQAPPVRPEARVTPATPMAPQSLGSTPMPPGSMPDQWRATSRFGYGPSAEQAYPSPAPRGKAWALAALQQAVDASRRPVQIPTEISGFEAPLPELFAKEKASQEQRRSGRLVMTAQAAKAAQAMGDNPAMAPATTPPDQGNPLRLFSQEVQAKAADWRLMACSQPQLENPLLARMTEFWFNHLNVYEGKASDRVFVGHYVLNAIRPHALGRFEELLLVSARHPAMLHYLDQVRSRADSSPSPKNAKTQTGLNENYARELMELHTLGVDGGYTQQDVHELARILSGWTVDPAGDSGFRFNPRWHDNGVKILLGHRFSNGGEQEGEDAIRMLARQPATAHRIGLRLAQWFVADNPPTELVQQLAQRYLQTQGDIRAVMQALIESPDTWAAQNQLFKTPMDYACSVLTALGPAVGNKQIQQARRFLRDAGQPVHGWLTPDGYSSAATAWLSPEAMARRTDFAMLAGRALPQVATLTPWLPNETWSRIAQEPVAQQAGLAFSSPAFMRK
jgi:uncharacterized protein (DUF1800 family)